MQEVLRTRKIIDPVIDATVQLEYVQPQALAPVIQAVPLRATSILMPFASA
jgi:hypothetical protein